MAILGKAMITPKGIYNNDVYYNKYDLVYYGGSSYLALDNNIVGIKPNTNPTMWKCLIEGGSSYTLANSSGTTIVFSVTDGTDIRLEDSFHIASVSED